MAIVMDQIRHPDYTAAIQDWIKWRICYLGGEIFKQRYLKQFTQREDAEMFLRRKELSPIPRFAGAAVDEVKNSITVRLSDVKRTNGPQSYVDACAGKNGGVDRKGSSMKAFMVEAILPEMLSMRSVGVYIDKDPIEGKVNRRTAKSIVPYLYYYQVEDLLSWDTYVYNNECSYKALLLREQYDLYDDVTGLPMGCNERLRRVWINNNGKVSVEFFNQTRSMKDGKEVREYVSQGANELNITEIPFVDFTISKSLMEDIADYQIALLNMESADVSYSYGANFPIYVEQYAQNELNSHIKKLDSETGDPLPKQNKQVDVGPFHGRRYPQNLDSPGFIHPSSEPLQIAMKKEEQIKEDIRQLLGLTISSLQPAHASADSKQIDKQTLEAGLSSIGLELQTGEQRISRIWALYEGDKSVTTVSYPTTYALVTDDQRIDSAVKLQGLQGAAPSKMFQKYCAKNIAKTMFENKVPQEDLDKMIKEIDAAKYITSDSIAITADLENGLVSEMTASNARGYDGATEVPIAREEHAAKAARIVTAQTSAKAGIDGANARGVPALGNDPKGAAKEKAATQTAALNTKGGTKQVRGPNVS